MFPDDPTIPEHGTDREALLEEMKALREQDVRWQEHRAFSLVFHQSDEHTDFLKEAHGLFFEGNGLNPMAFASLRKFEHEVVRMTADLFHGGRECVGTMTSGGTESIMLAVKTYRDRARKLRPWIKKPEIIVPQSVHVAFPKAGKYFDVQMITAPLDRSFHVDTAAVEKLIGPNTIALVGSAPNYPSGMIDPIERLSDLALKYDLGLHVDACIGGFFLPWAERLGHPIPPFDYRIPGVTSMSADLHKYGYAAKGASTITYRSMDYLRHQFFVDVNWPGGIFASPSFPGTRPGGTIAAAWAALKAMGQDGYLRNAEQVMRVAKQFVDGINSIDGLEVLGDPPVGVFAYRTTTKKLSIYAVADAMTARGWHIDRQQKPASIHLMINPGHAEIADQYLEDLRESVAAVRANPKAAVSGSAPAYGLLANAPMRGLVEKNVLAMMEKMYGPDGMAPQLGTDNDGDNDAVPGPLMTLMKIRNTVRQTLGR